MDLEVGYGKKKRIIKKKIDLNLLGSSKPNSKKAKEFIEQAKKLQRQRFFQSKGVYEKNKKEVLATREQIR